MKELTPQEHVYRQSNNDLTHWARPWKWEQFWNYDLSNAVRRMAQQDRDKVYPKLSILIGERGSGKSSAAKLRGMMASCEVMENTPPDKRNGLPGNPCGLCEGCRSVQESFSIWDTRYLEIDGASPHVLEDLETALGIRFHKRRYEPPLVPYVIAIHEAVNLPSGIVNRLKELVINDKRCSFLLLYRKAELDKVPEPLINRAGANLLEFAIPTISEATSGLISVAEICGTGLERPAAEMIAQEYNGDPRECLSVLNMTRPHWPKVTATAVDELLQTLGRDNAAYT